MKNNIFLSSPSKKVNDRFNFLEVNEKDKPYNSSIDKIKKPSNLHHESTFNTDKEKFANTNNPTRQSRFSDNLKELNKKSKPKPEFNLLDEDFPVLNLKKDNLNTELDTSYRDITAIKEKLNNDFPENNIKPGHVEIYNKGIFKYGPLTTYQIQMNKINLKKELLAQDSNYCMNQSINFMRKNWQNYRDNYDSIYGIGAYEDKFIYKSEFESEDENDYDSSTDVDSEIDNIYNNDSYRDDYYYRDY
jgi:hypothetical protein